MEASKQQHTQTGVIFDKRWFFVCAIGILGLWLFLSSMGSLAFPLFVSMLLHYSTRPLVHLLEQYLQPRVVYTATACGIVGLLFCVVFIVVPNSVMQLEHVMHVAPKALMDFSHWLDVGLKDYMPYSNDAVVIAAQHEWLANFTMSMKNTAALSLSRIVQSLRLLLSSALSMSLVPVLYYVMGCYGADIVEALLAWVPDPLRITAIEWLNGVDGCLSTYVFGQVSVIVVLMVFYSVGLWYIGLPMAFLLGSIAGLMVFIPIVGHCFSFMLSVLVGFSVFSDAHFIAQLLLLYGTLIVADNIWITPRFLGQVMGFSAPCVLVLIAFGQQWFGVWGVLLAAPVVTIGRYMLKTIYSVYHGSQFFYLARWPGKSPSTH